MKRVLLFICVVSILILGINDAFSQTAESALMSLKKIESKLQVGITLNDYQREIGDAKFNVNLFLENRKLDDLIQLKEEISNIMALYQLAGNLWFLEIEKPKSYISVNDEIFKAIRTYCPEIPVDKYYLIKDLRLYIWQYASVKINDASNLPEQSKGWWQKLWKYFEK